jgi:hypothetical protein
MSINIITGLISTKYDYFVGFYLANTVVWMALDYYVMVSFKRL